MEKSNITELGLLHIHQMQGKALFELTLNTEISSLKIKKGRKISITNILLCFRSIIFFEVIGSQNRVRDQQPGYRLGAFGSADSQALCGPTEWVALWAGGTHQP